MRSIQKLAHRIQEELEDAQRYIEKKAAGKQQWASKFQKMAEDELQHAAYLHGLFS